MICRAIPYEGKEPYIFLSYCHKDAMVTGFGMTTEITQEMTGWKISPII